MNIWVTYKKAKAVVASCDDLAQLPGAKRYINLWFKYYSHVGKNNKLLADELVAGLYEKLRTLIYIKKFEITRGKNG